MAPQAEADAFIAIRITDADSGGGGMIPLTLVVATMAMTLFGLATPAHHERRLGGFVLPTQQRRLRILAWSLMALAVASAVAAKGWVFGPILGVGAMMFGAGAVFLMFNLLPVRSPSGKSRRK